MKLGIVGLPNVGKSTLFNSLTKGGAESANYPFCTIEPNVGVVSVPDERLKNLEKIYTSEKVTPAIIEFVDIAGLVKGASKGEGLGNQFLSHIREVDAVIHVVRCFEDENIIHVSGEVDPISDIETINLELIYADLDVIERRLSKVIKSVKADKSYEREAEVLNKLKQDLNDGKCARTVLFDDETDKQIAASLNLITGKPVIYAANVIESDICDDASKSNNENVKKVYRHAVAEGSEVFVVCAKIEEEMSELNDDEKKMFLDELGIEQSGLDKLIIASYKLLGLISFLTAGQKEVRAWTITKGTKAPQAAGKIHSDFEKGFIKAEIVNYNDLVRLGSYGAVKENGLIRLEGKDYVVREDDIILFRFSPQ